MALYMASFWSVTQMSAALCRTTWAYLVHSASFSRRGSSAVITRKRHGWLLSPLGAQRPASRMVRISSRLTGSSVNLRMLRRSRRARSSGVFDSIISTPVSFQYSMVSTLCFLRRQVGADVTVSAGRFFVTGESGATVFEKNAKHRMLGAALNLSRRQLSWRRRKKY